MKYMLVLILLFPAAALADEWSELPLCTQALSAQGMAYGNLLMAYNELKSNHSELEQSWNEWVDYGFKKADEVAALTAQKEKLSRRLSRLLRRERGRGH